MVQGTACTKECSQQAVQTKLVWFDFPVFQNYSARFACSHLAFTPSQAISFVSCCGIAGWQAPMQILKHFRHLKLENSMCMCTCMCVYMYVCVHTGMSHEIQRRPRTKAICHVTRVKPFLLASKLKNKYCLSFFLISSIDIIHCTASIICLRRLIEVSGTVCILTACVSRDTENSLNHF